MSTRAQVGFYDKKPEEITREGIYLYRHSDGYPREMVPDIMDFCVLYLKGRSHFDAGYMRAQLIARLVSKYQRWLIGHGLEWGFQVNTGDWWRGYSIDAELQGDIEYFYAVYPGAMDVYEAHTYGQVKMKLLGTIKFEDWQKLNKNEKAELADKIEG